MGIRERVCACTRRVPAHTLVPRTVSICTHEDIRSLWVFVCKRGSAHMGIFTQERDCTRWVLHTVGPAQVEVCACALARRWESAHGGLFSVLHTVGAPPPRPGQGTAHSRPCCSRVGGGAARAAEHAPGPCAATARLPTPAPGPAGQAAPAGRGAASGAGRLFRALARCPGPARQAAPGRRRSQKEGLCRRPALGPAARRQGLGEGDAAGTAAGADPPPPPPPGRPQTPRLAGTSGRLAPPGAGGGGRQARGAPVRTGSAPRARMKGALERVGAPDVGKREGQAPALRPLGDFSGSRTPASVSNYPVLSTEEAGTPACWVGRGVWGQGQRPSPPPVSGGRAGWREGVVRLLKAELFTKRFRALNGFTSPRGRAVRLSLLWMGKLSHARCAPRG